LVLGQANFTSRLANAGGAVSASSLFQPVGIYSDGTKLYVADSNNHRILIWNTIPTSNNQAANIVLGQTNLISNSSNSGGLSASSLNLPYDVKGDGTHLFVSDSLNGRVLIWNTLPSSNGQAANVVLGKANMTSAVNTGITASNMSTTFGLYVSAGRLLVADSGNNRVLGWNSIPTSNAQAADFVLGQPGFTTGTINNGGVSFTGLYQPHALFCDGTRIFLPDTYNYRVIVAPIPGI
jgi:hypothetical protein